MRKPVYFVGIDPGKNGGIAILTSGGKDTDSTPKSKSAIVSPPRLLEAFAMPSKLTDLYDRIKYTIAAKFSARPGFIYLEKVGGYMPGKKGNIGSAMFTFGEQYGALRMAIIANGLGSLYRTVQPSVWMPEVGLIHTKKDFTDEAQWKRYLKRRAQELFPDTKVTLKTADALLIAYYCYLKKS